MKRYIAYFDYLGYKDFILNNESQHLEVRAGHILRDIEMALAQGKYQEPRNGIILSDLSKSRINCLNVSDTVIFWTHDDSIESLEELMHVAYRFNWQEILFNMPVRGVVYFDEVELIFRNRKKLSWSNIQREFNLRQRTRQRTHHDRNSKLGRNSD